MGKSKKDACGGHANRFFEIRGGICGNTAHFRRWAKDRSNRLIRRQFKKAEAEAYQDYLDDLEERRIFDREMMEYAMLMEDMYAGEYDDYDLKLQREDDYHPMYESEYEPDYWPGDFDFDYPEPAPIAKPFVYERDIGSY